MKMLAVGNVAVILLCWALGGVMLLGSEHHPAVMIPVHAAFIYMLLGQLTASNLCKAYGHNRTLLDGACARCGAGPAKRTKEIDDV